MGKICLVISSKCYGRLNDMSKIANIKFVCKLTCNITASSTCALKTLWSAYSGI